MSDTKPTMVTLSITSGKGGVGKTNVVVNLAVSLARLRRTAVSLSLDEGQTRTLDLKPVPGS